MSLIIATGSNLKDPIKNLNQALESLKKHYKLIAASRIYTSKAVDYEDQPDFYNQVLEFEIPHQTPDEVMKSLLNLEALMGRERRILRGPRTIDLDLIFWGLETFQTQDLIIPHPRWQERSFVVYPLRELPFFEKIKNHFEIPTKFLSEASQIA